jgi:hypothetical protein
LDGQLFFQWTLGANKFSGGGGGIYTLHRDGFTGKKQNRKAYAVR